MGAMMNKLVQEAAKLPPDEQEEWAAVWLDELASGHRWDDTFAATQDALGRWANEIEKEVAAGLDTPMDFDRRR